MPGDGGHFIFLFLTCHRLPPDGASAINSLRISWIVFVFWILAMIWPGAEDFRVFLVFLYLSLGFVTGVEIICPVFLESVTLEFSKTSRVGRTKGVSFKTILNCAGRTGHRRTPQREYLSHSQPLVSRAGRDSERNGFVKVIGRVGVLVLAHAPNQGEERPERRLELGTQPIRRGLSIGRGRSRREAVSGPRFAVMTDPR